MSIIVQEQLKMQEEDKQNLQSLLAQLNEKSAVLSDAIKKHAENEDFEAAAKSKAELKQLNTSIAQVRFDLEETKSSIDELTKADDFSSAGMSNANAENAIDEALQKGQINISTNPVAQPAPEQPRPLTPEEQVQQAEDYVSSLRNMVRARISNDKEAQENLAGFKAQAGNLKINGYSAYMQNGKPYIFAIPSTSLFFEIMEQIEASPDPDNQLRNDIEAAIAFASKLCAHPPLYRMSPKEIRDTMPPGILSSFGQKLLEDGGFAEQLGPSTEL